MESSAPTQHFAPHLEEIVTYFRSLQDRICDGLASADGQAQFQEDLWERPGGGGGRTRVLAQGGLIERGGVNFSHVHGPLPEVIANKLNLPQKAHFHATGVSLVIHPKSPHIPIVHMNVRYFEIDNGVHWFGGGIDLTPIYIIPEDAAFFHQEMKAACDPFGKELYPHYKDWCDKYFYIRHRKETRGIGGIFFDHIKAADVTEKTHNFHFVQSVGDRFLPTYLEIIRRHREKEYGERERDFQLLRRSRYVEFNLVYDRGTKFGLDTDGRTESILMSMPPLARWEYDYRPEPGSPEAFTMANLKARDW